MKKKTYVVGVVVLLAALLALPGVGQSAMWVGAEIGGNFAATSSPTVGNGVGSVGSTNFQPAVIGGMTVGYDFVNAGFGAYAWPDWMKYFSFATDITYNKLSVQPSGTGLGGFMPLRAHIDGYAVAWTFLFMAHYGFLPDSEVPSGRINPYIGVGPAVVFSGINANDLGGSNNSTNVALVVEPGIRWVCFKNVSIDTAFRYRYLEPSYDIGNASVKIPLNLFSFLVRANYHF